jgi:hypothetical protein
LFVAALVATTWQVPADVEVSESLFEIEQPAVPVLLTANETVPVSLPPVVKSRRLVRYVPEVEEKVNPD